MEAYPAAVTFSWYFNNSEHKEAINEERFTTNGLVSTLNFAPTTNQDYGTLFCLGENAVGHQDEPCAFKIVPTGKKPNYFLQGWDFDEKSWFAIYEWNNTQVGQVYHAQKIH